MIQARAAPFDAAALPAYPSAFNAIEITDGYALVENLRIVGGATGIKLHGRDGPCVKNTVRGVSVWDTQIGIVLDGHTSADRPCYWNWITECFVGRPALHGVLLTTLTGDTPNANKFTRVRVYSLAAPMSGCGFLVSTGRFHNAFTDCEANIHPDAQACFRLGAITDETCVTNFYAECSGAVPGVRIDNGSLRTSIVNLFSATAGAPIWDTTSTGNYVALNAGDVTRNKLRRTVIEEACVGRQEWETAFYEAQAAVTLAPSKVVHLVSSWTSPVTATLAAPSTCNGVVQIVKKTDLSANPVTITQTGGGGPDAWTITLANQFDHVVVLSNGSAWHVVASLYDRPVATWPNPTGSAFTRGPFNADDLENVPFEYSRDVVNNLNYRLRDTRAILRALILDLKMAKMFR